MKAIFNSRIVSTDDQLITTTNRAFCYGDGLFETIVTGPGRISLIEYHIGRLSRACHIMGIKFPEPLTAKKVAEMISHLASLNEFNGLVRTKLSLWRNEGGLYTPTASEASFYLETSTSDTPIYRGLKKVGLSKNYHTQYSPISFAKTSNALTYVLAGHEKRQNGLDDILLTDNHGNISESHIGNIFWVIDHEVFTPKLTTGCVSGVMREFILDFYLQQNKPVIEVECTVSTLKHAQSIFMTNASGISFLKEFNGASLQNPKPILEGLIKRLQQP